MATHTGYANSLEEHIIKLADDINDLNPRNLFELLKTKLEETRREGHRTVDQFYERERQKLEEQLRSPGKKLKEAQTKWRSLDSKSIITHETINQLQKTVAEGEKELQDMQVMKEKGNMDFPKVLFSNGGSADAKNAIAFDGGMPPPLVAPAIPLSNTVLRIFNPVPMPIQYPIPGSGAPRKYFQTANRCFYFCFSICFTRSNQIVCCSIKRTANTNSNCSTAIVTFSIFIESSNFQLFE